MSENNNYFDLCPPGTYLTNGNKITCDECLHEAECKGGYIPIVTKSKFWREFNNTEKIFECNSH